jgi:diguanylate cyclase
MCAHRDESGAVLGFAVMDFTRLSARHGVLAAERVVALLAGILRQRVRRSDVVARVGASAFAVLVPGLDESSARRKGEQLRRHVEQSTFKYNDSVLPIALEVVVEAGQLGSTAILKDALARLHVGPEAT